MTIKKPGKLHNIDNFFNNINIRPSFSKVHMLSHPSLLAAAAAAEKDCKSCAKIIGLLLSKGLIVHLLGLCKRNSNVIIYATKTMRTFDWLISGTKYFDTVVFNHRRHMRANFTAYFIKLVLP